MSEEDPSRAEENPNWPEFLLKLPEFLLPETVKELHASIEHECDSLERTACQTAAGRAVWKHVIRDPIAEILAGETNLKTLQEKIRKDRINNAREISGVVLAVRTLWFDTKLEAALASFNGGDEEPQVVLLGAGMDARVYRLNCLKESRVFEVDFPNLLQMKAALLKATTDLPTMLAKSVIRVEADIRENDWFQKLQRSGFIPEKKTVWILEGILYYLSHLHAMEVLKSIAANCRLTHTVLLADFMNKSATSLLSHSNFHFYSDWPEHLLPSLGFSHVRLSQIGDPDANFGLMHDPDNMFNRLRELPRSMLTNPEDGTPCRRLYLVQAWGSPGSTATQ